MRPRACGCVWVCVACVYVRKHLHACLLRVSACISTFTACSDTSVDAHRPGLITFLTPMEALRISPITSKQIPERPEDAESVVKQLPAMQIILFFRFNLIYLLQPIFIKRSQWNGITNVMWCRRGHEWLFHLILSCGKLPCACFDAICKRSKDVCSAHHYYILYCPCLQSPFKVIGLPNRPL